MDQLSSDKFQKIIFGVQDILFKKGTMEEAFDYLAKEGLTLEVILAEYVLEENETRVELIISLIDLLLKFKGFDQALILFIQSESKKHPDNVLILNSVNAKRFFLQVIKSHIASFVKEAFLPKLLKIYFLDESPGIFEAATNLLIALFNNKDYQLYYESEHLMDNIIEYFNNILMSTDSIFQIRKFEILLKYITTVYPNQCNSSIVELDTMASKFYINDMLTQLAFLETMENLIKTAPILDLLSPSTHLLNQNVMDLQPLTFRKILYTFSKFYAADILSELKVIKNTLALAFQYYEDNKSNEFICPIILNVFHNRKIYDYLMDSANNSQFDFKKNINQIIVENYCMSDPMIKMQILEIFGVICSFEKEINHMQMQYLMELVRMFVGQWWSEFEVKTNDDALSKFVEKVYQDFKKHDLADYEEQFLDFLFSFTTNITLLKALLSNFDFVLYLLNRREKPQDVLLKKYKLIKEIANTKVFNDMSKEFADQFTVYIQKGPY